jgi:hypothetical protein
VKKLLICLACAIAPGVLCFIASAPVRALQQKPAAPETLMLFAHQEDDPVRIIQASFGADNALLDAQLENKTHQKVQTYRLGWVAVKKDDIRIGKATEVEVPNNVDTTTSFSIPGPQNAAKEDVGRHPTGIIFYVAELQFADGTRWQAEVKKIRKEAAEMVK